MTVYQEIIANGLNVDADTAESVRDFICKYFDFEWCSATILDIVRVAKYAKKMMDDDVFSQIGA